MITGINSSQNVEVNGIPQRISDVRPATPLLDDNSKNNVENDDQDEEICSEADGQDSIPRVARTRKPPDRFKNNIYDT